jgi:hypothetical protein
MLSDDLVIYKATFSISLEYHTWTIDKSTLPCSAMESSFVLKKSHQGYSIANPREWWGSWFGKLEYSQVLILYLRVVWIVISEVGASILKYALDSWQAWRRGEAQFSCTIAQLSFFFACISYTTELLFSGGVYFIQTWWRNWNKKDWTRHK